MADPATYRHHLSVWLWITELPVSKRPCMVSRGEASTLLAVHPGVPRVQIVDWCVHNLFEDERNAFREAYGQLPVGMPLQDWVLNGDTFLNVPPAIDAEHYHMPALDVGA